MKPKLGLLLVLVLVVPGCGKGSKPGNRGKSDGSSSTAATSGPAVAPTSTPGNQAAVAKGNNQFAVDLYAKLSIERKDGNIFFSPFSISTALSMTYAGARGKTAEEMKNALHFTLPDQKLHSAMGALMGDLNAAGKSGGFQLSVANALWAEKSHQFLPEFLALNKANYGAGLETVDFAGDTEGARKTINSWVEKQTQDRIKDLIQPGVLHTITRLVLTDAIYFKGEWRSKFEASATKDEPFRLDGGKKIAAPMMHQFGVFDYAEGHGFKALELPYRGGSLAMLVLLPDKDDGLAAMEKALTVETIAKIRTSEADVTLTLPKFTMTSEFSLQETLSALGMKTAFLSGIADLSGIDGVTDPGGRLYMSAVVHKAWVDVSEKGTEAAAATAVVVDCEPSKPPKRKKVTFTADHPFIFAIRDQETGSILFLGRVANPKG
jgi:serpin B